MSDFDFSQPQRQSKTGLVLIFAATVYNFLRAGWVVILAILAGRNSPKLTSLLILGGILLLLLGLGYSIIYYLRFRFHIDEKNREFVVEKGVLSSDVVVIPFNKIQQVKFKRNILQRILNVSSVVVETAGSQGKEVEIKALSQEAADVLADRLMSLSQKVKRTEEDGAETEEAGESFLGTPEWQHKVSLFTLVKLGLTSNYLRGVALIIAFYFTLRQEFRLEDTLPAGVPKEQLLGTGSLIFILFLLFIGMVITVGETVIKYYDLNLKKFSDSLQVEMGLRNNVKVNIKANRIQVMEVVTNPLQKKLDLYKLKLSLASSENELGKSHIRIPGIPPDIVAEIKKYFFKIQVTEKLYFLPNQLYLARRISRGMIPAVVVIGLVFFFREYVSLAYAGILLSVYLVLMTVYNYFYYKSLRLSVSDDFLVKHSGLWIKKEQYLEIYRLQSVSVRQPLWYKNRGVVNLTFHSAGGDLNFYVVKTEEVRPLLNFVLYKIESTTDPWM